jgi:hypothetical protein
MITAVSASRNVSFDLELKLIRPINSTLNLEFQSSTSSSVITCSPGFSCMIKPCTTCSPGCIPCDAGYYSPQSCSIWLNSSSIKSEEKKCLPCLEGFISQPGSSFCTSCPFGTTAKSGSSECFKVAEFTLLDENATIPTIAPSLEPSIIPTIEPSIIPSYSPTYEPSIESLYNPTVKPSFIPTMNPSSRPSITPTVTPSQIPSIVPSIIPTTGPTEALCGPGNYSPTGRAPCAPCPIGTSASTSGSEICSICAGGKYSSGGSSACTFCPANQISAAGSGTCYNACPTGSYPNPSSGGSCSSVSSGIEVLFQFMKISFPFPFSFSLKRLLWWLLCYKCMP